MHSKQVFSLCFSSMLLLICSVSFQTNAQPPRINPNDLVTNGESFFEMSNITSELSRLAREDGVIGPGEEFRTVSKSGQPLSVIVEQYKACNPKPLYLVTNGGGIDMMGSCGANPSPSCGVISGALNDLRNYIEEMKKGGTKKFIYMSYPDVFGFGEGNLKANLPVFNPEVEKICKASEDPICTWVDLRAIWQGKERQYSSDGIHCSDEGGRVTAQAFWDAIKANDWEFLRIGTSVQQKLNNNNTGSLRILNQIVRNGKLSMSLSIEQSSDITIQLTTMSGRSIFTAQKYVAKGDKQNISLPTGALAKGIYCCEVRAGNMTNQSKVFVP